MAKKPEELLLYQMRLGLTARKSLLDTHLAVEASKPGTMDEAQVLAEAVRDMINMATGQVYQNRSKARCILHGQKQL
jgi:hypothetical protein